LEQHFVPNSINITVYLVISGNADCRNDCRNEQFESYPANKKAGPFLEDRPWTAAENIL